jgi:hypothetical protein
VFKLDVSGTFRTSGGSRICIQGSVDGGTTNGLYYWDLGDSNWVKVAPQNLHRVLLLVLEHLGLRLTPLEVVYRIIIIVDLFWKIAVIHV